MIIGWLLGLPVPLLIMTAPHWSWVVFANLLLGAQQGLCWSTTVIAKIDLAGPKQRGLAMGLNEFAGYGAVAVAAYAASELAERWGLRLAPFLLGTAFSVTGLFLSLCCVRETLPYAQLEGRLTAAQKQLVHWTEIARSMSWGDKRLFAISQAGLVNNLNDAMVWGLLPLWLAAKGTDYTTIGVVTGAYPFVWGIGQILAGSLSDRFGRTPFIAVGMVVQAIAITAFMLKSSLIAWLSAAVLLGIGTAMVYPTLLAAVSDLTPPAWRASAVGVYRFWRDFGYVVGAIFSGVLADYFGIPAAFGVVATLTLTSGVLAGVLLRRTTTAQQCIKEVWAC